VAVPQAQLDAAWKRLPPKLQSAFDTAAANIRAYAELQLPRTKTTTPAPGLRLSQIVRPLVGTENRETSRHAEMHQKAMTIVKVNQNILGPALEAHDLPALQPGGETGGKGKAQAGAAKLHAGNGAARKDRAKPTHNSFNFGKFRHDY